MSIHKLTYRNTLNLHVNFVMITVQTCMSCLGCVLPVSNEPCEPRPSGVDGIPRGGAHQSGRSTDSGRAHGAGRPLREALSHFARSRAAGGTSVVGNGASPKHPQNIARERSSNRRYPVQITTIGTKVSKINNLLIICKVSLIQLVTHLLIKL